MSNPFHATRPQHERDAARIAELEAELKTCKSRFNGLNRIVDGWAKSARDWEAKHKIVCHENNCLRSANQRLKEKRDAAKEIEVERFWREAESKPNRMSEVFGSWPRDETDEEIEATLEKLR